MSGSGITPTPSGFWSGSLLTPTAANASMLSGVSSVFAVAGSVQSAIGSYYQAKSTQYQIETQASTQKYQLKSQALDYESRLLSADYNTEAAKLSLGSQLETKLYGIDVSKIQLNTDYDAARFKEGISNMNARGAERAAQAILLQGEKDIGISTLRAGKAKSEQLTSMAARGIQLGVGSAAEVISTTDLMKETDALTISANATRAAGQARMTAANYEAEGMMQGARAKAIQENIRVLDISKQIDTEVYKATVANVATNEELAANVYRLSIGNAERSAKMVTDFSSSISPVGSSVTSLMGSAAALAKTWYQDRRIASLASALGAQE